MDILTVTLGVSKNNGKTPQIIHFNGVFHYFHHPFLGFLPLFLGTSIYVFSASYSWAWQIFRDLINPLDPPNCFFRDHGISILEDHPPFLSSTSLKISKNNKKTVKKRDFLVSFLFSSCLYPLKPGFLLKKI